MRKAGERAYLSRQIWIHPFCPNYTCSLNGRPASADFIAPLEMMELSCRAFSSLKASNEISWVLFNSNFDWTYRQCIWRKSMMGLMIRKSSLVWYSSRSHFVVFSWISKKLEIQVLRDDFVEPDCIIIIIEEGIIECKCPLEPWYECSILKFSYFFVFFCMKACTAFSDVDKFYIKKFYIQKITGTKVNFDKFWLPIS